MVSRPAPIEIPNKQIFKPAEVCEVLAIPTYVLRTWENEFKDLGVSGSPGSPRTYRRADVELAARIRDLVFAEHLTLAGVRRKLEQEHLLQTTDGTEPLSLPAPSVRESVAAPAGPKSEKLQEVKRELRELLGRLASDARRELQEASAIPVAAGAAVQAADEEEPAAIEDVGAADVKGAGGAPVKKAAKRPAIAVKAETTARSSKSTGGRTRR